MWTDTHTNLHHERFDEDRDAVVKRARDAGVKMVEICQDEREVGKVREVAARYQLPHTVGTHPHYARDASGTVESLLALADDPNVVGIGETGLDFHYGYSDEASQRANFARHIAVSQRTGKPLVVHSREADAMMAEMLREANADSPFSILLHCFTAGPELADAVLELDGYISFSGILTFKNANDVREAAMRVPDDRILVETDCPYLTPVPHRGQRCEPVHVALVGECLAELRGWSAKECARITTANARRIFGLAA